jgi:hypothetical protein
MALESLRFTHQMIVQRRINQRIHNQRVALLRPGQRLRDLLGDDSLNHIVSRANRENRFIGNRCGAT